MDLIQIGQPPCCQGESGDGTHIDPVCGMTVDPATTPHRHSHGGVSYFFCSGGCRAKFASDPKKYLDPSEAPTPTGTIFTCPMHPDVRQDGLGSCPICGMALEPETPTADTGSNPELTDITRRFWIGVLLTLQIVMFAYQGVELIGVASCIGDTWEPLKRSLGSTLQHIANRWVSLLGLISARVCASLAVSNPLRGKTMHARIALPSLAVFSVLAVCTSFALSAGQAKSATVLNPTGGYQVDSVHSTVIFKIKHLNTSWTFGRFDRVSGTFSIDATKPEKSSLAVEIEAESVDTGQAKRDETQVNWTLKALATDPRAVTFGTLIDLADGDEMMDADHAADRWRLAGHHERVALRRLGTRVGIVGLGVNRAAVLQTPEAARDFRVVVLQIVRAHLVYHDQYEQPGPRLLRRRRRRGILCVHGHDEDGSDHQKGQPAHGGDHSAGAAAHVVREH
jgi:YHS domain-containing protein